ncbi:MipA/OmpV family protein [Rhodoplanes roseus]|uniref:MipA/OmpV family protein n=1 Tax=Rhodoplanes roseus TaxID=29409 RepID=UPI0011B38B7A|nr:MipA/OmpV family protein [Rhodoplanes roseus]
MTTWLALGGIAAAADLGYGAPAATYAEPAKPTWIATLGLEGRMESEFVGGDTYTLRAAPIFGFRKAGTPEQFRAPRDGAGIALFETQQLKIGPNLKVRANRKESDSSALYGLGDVDWAVEVGGFVEYWWAPWMRTRAEVRQGFGGHHGVVADLSADAVVPITPALTLSGGPRISFATSKALEPYFGIDPWQSFWSGLPTYDAKGGLYSVGAGAQARYFWTPELATHVYVEYQRLMDSAADSPLVVYRGSPDQVTVGFGFTRAFTFQQFW